MEEKEVFWLEENYITNVEEIVQLAEEHNSKFANRSEGKFHAFKSEKYGPSKLFTLFDRDMSKDLKNAITKTIKPEELEIPPSYYLLNRYDPGCFLKRHRDMVGGNWKFYLIFLRSDKPHLKIYSEKYPDGKLIDEKPGALFHMPLSMEHEVTEIGLNERPKYSLVMGWDY